MIVIDASFAGSWLLPDESTNQAEKVLRNILRGREQLAVPHLWAYEMTNLLLSAIRRNRIAPEQIGNGLRLLHAIPCTYFDHNTLLSRSRIARFASQFGLSAYDSAYLELADRLQCALRSNDRELRKAAQALGLH